MRKFQHVALVAAAAGGLSAIGVVPSFADAPAAYNAAPPPAPQQGSEAASWTSSQATAHTTGSPAPQRLAAPTGGADVSPQLNPQVNPKLSPQLTQQPTAQGQSAPVEQNNLFRPYQECSPQNLLNANLPVALLAAAETKGVNCGQGNSQANALAKAH
ncbi:hypothetical protein [Streptomyces spinosirectus]